MSIHYFPRLTFTENKTSSFSVGIPFTAGTGGDLFFFSSDLFPTDDEYLTILQAPLMVDFNYGTGADKRTPHRTGFFLGGGFGYHVTGVDIESEYIYGSSVYRIRKSYSRGFCPCLPWRRSLCPGQKGQEKHRNEGIIYAGTERL